MSKQVSSASAYRNLDQAETRTLARRYLRTQLETLSHVPGESEYVVRTRKLPDRRLNFDDQRLARRLRRYSTKKLHSTGKSK